MPLTQRILFIDAYDSFTKNIVALLHQCIPFTEVDIIHIDSNIKQECGVDFNVYATRFDAIVLGPGPGDPRNEHDIGLFQEALKAAFDLQIPLLGICLGFQALCLQYGHKVIRMKMPCHGQAKNVKTSGDDMFANLAQGKDVSAVCYNSLAVQTADFNNKHRGREFNSSNLRSRPSINSSTSMLMETRFRNRLKLLAWDNEGYAMAVRHEDLPLWGVQFHPESCLSSDGERIMRNWWMMTSPYKFERSMHEIPKSLTVRPEKAVLLLKSLRDVNCRSTAKPGNVSWRIIKVRALSSQDLSEMCHEAAGSSSIAMLESVSKGRYCIYGFTDTTSEVVHYARGKLKSVIGEKIISETVMTPSEALQTIEQRTKVQRRTGGCPKFPFWGGWIGYLSYELGLDLIGVTAEEERMVPDLSFVFVERSVVLDQRTGNVCIQSIRDNDEAWILDMKHKLTELNRSKGTAAQPAKPCLPRATFADTKISLPDRDDYQRSYARCDEHLHAGNSYELCLTCEARIDMSSSTPNTSYLLYQNLIKHNPVPFAAFLRFPGDGDRVIGTTILSTSPEQFLSCSRTGVMDMIPMKGTVQRSQVTNLEDAYRILYSPKETAENLMIADLIRHDLYSVVGCKPYAWLGPSSNTYSHTNEASCERGTTSNEGKSSHSASDTARDQAVSRNPVCLLALNVVKPFATVYQLVSHIRAYPPPSLDPSDSSAVIEHNHSALHHVLPPGSMTGAPKKRSCEILQQLESRNRGVYSGIIGYMDVGGGCSWSVAIRAAFSSDSEDYVIDRIMDESGDEIENGQGMVEVEKRKIWHVGAGGAITVLSNLEGEWDEMMGKMTNVLKCFQVAKEEFPCWSPE